MSSLTAAQASIWGIAQNQILGVEEGCLFVAGEICHGPRIGLDWIVLCVARFGSPDSILKRASGRRACTMTTKLCTVSRVSTALPIFTVTISFFYFRCFCNVLIYFF